MVVNRHGQGDLRLVLANDVLVQDRLHLHGLQQHRSLVGVGGFFPVGVAGFRENPFLHQHIVAKGHAAVADIGPGRVEHPLHALLGFATEAAPHLVVIRHESMPPS